MEDIIIKLPEGAYKLLQTEGVDWLGAEHILDAVANGVLLPKGHGRLKDENEIKKLIEGAKVENESSKTFAENIIRFAPTVIEADSESEE